MEDTNQQADGYREPLIIIDEIHEHPTKGADRPAPYSSEGAQCDGLDSDARPRLALPATAAGVRVEMADCAHEQFGAEVDVHRLEDSGKFIADVRVKCVQCDEPFRFVGLTAGISFDQPTVSIDETELHAPIEPEGEKRLQTRALFQMPQVLHRN